VKQGGLVDSMLGYGSWGRQFKTHRGLGIVNLQKGCFWVDSALLSTPCVYLVEGKAAREKRWPPPSYAGPRNVKGLTLHEPTTIWLWDYLYLTQCSTHSTKCNTEFYNLFSYLFLRPNFFHASARNLAR